MPGTTTAGRRFTGEPRTHSPCDQCRPATALGFPLPPQSGPKPQPDPTGEIDQHLGGFAEAEIAAPASHIGGQLLYRPLDTNAFGSSRDLSDSSLEPIQGLRCNHSLDLWASGKAESEKLPFLRSCHGALGLIYLELEVVRDESRDALHHPPTRLLAAHVDIAIIGEAHIAMSATL